MNHTEMVAYALKSMKQRQIRSWLTILGIVVGITAVVLMVGLAQGLKDDINSQLASFGPRTIVVAPFDMEGGGGAASFAAGGVASAHLRPTSGKLYEKDADRIKRIGAIDTLAEVITGRAVIGFKNEEATSGVYAVEPDVFKQTVAFEVSRGRFLETSDRKVAIIGDSIAEDTFKTKVDVGSILEIGNETYRVVGVLKKTGNSFFPADSSVLVNFEDGKTLFASQLTKNEISVIRLVVKEGFSVTEVADEIEQTLLSSHRVTKDNKDFTLITPEFINKQVESITGLLTAILGGIAAISLLIGSIGISNTMFMSVLERRREIGILKSVGATREEIRDVFLVESAMIGIFGGVAGMFIAWLVITVLAALAVVPIVFTTSIALGALLFSAGVGVLAGTLPAAQAAKLDPIEALRYE